MKSSMSRSSDRRALLTGLCALGLSAVLPSAASAARRAGPFRSIVVDVGLMEARGLGPFAERVRVLLTRDMNREFAGRVTPNNRAAPVLVVTVRSVSLNGFAGPSGGRGGGRGGDGSSDFLDALLSVGRNTQPLLVSLASGGSAGRFGAVSDEDRRLAALTRSTAHWARRRLGG
jgi:hypothetical protein